jgi:signal transduction histidine kinase
VGKIEEGNIHPNYSDFDIQAMISNMLQEVQHLLKKGQKIDFIHTGNETTVHLDPSMLKHIVVNLLSNAIKFSPENSIVNLRTSGNNGDFRISIKDRGIGIPDEEQNDLFKRFFRSSNVTNIQGTGLGLHIVKKYAELMGGTVNYKSKLNEGTEFIIEFNKTKNTQINEDDTHH